MTEREAYKVLQAGWIKKYGAEVGDEVMITKSNVRNEYGSGAVLHGPGEMDDHGWRGWKIDCIDDDSLCIRNRKGKSFIMSVFSLAFISKAVKEVTMADLEAKYGCKIKVVK